MNTPVVRMVDAALKHSTLGVEKHLEALALDGSDLRPKMPSFLNTADDNSAVNPESLKSVAARDWPLIITTSGVPAPLKITGIVGQAWDAPSLKVLVLYVTGKTMDLADAWRDSDYSLRCCVLALNAALFASNTSAARQRGKVMIVKHNSMEFGPADNELELGRVTGVLTLDLHIRVQP